MKHIYKYIIVFILALITILVYLFYNNKLDNEYIKEKIIVNFYNHNGSYLVDLNNIENGKINIDINNMYVSGYQQTVTNKKREVLDGIDYKFYFNQSNNIIGHKMFFPKCSDCNYIYVYNDKLNKYQKIKIYNMNEERLLITNVIGYIE